jgi:hypothetical protein
MKQRKHPPKATRRLPLPDVPIVAPVAPPAVQPPPPSTSPTDLDDEAIRTMLEAAYTF